MNFKKSINLIKLSPSERYDYFIREVVQNLEIWLLETDDGYVFFKDNTKDNILPIWPSEELAVLCTFEEFKIIKARPVSINYDSFINNCIPDMITENIIFGVFYDNNRVALAVDGHKLLKDLTFEFSEIYDE